ncbi:ABC transporter ATP-binding protein [Pseudoroseomonas rhizosphaerae]|uniref:ABC transporter ATP-binding protein n=1 Tax=Teichococcus rhizosphaerae TaxID=1335062 RepID=A0A2C6Z9S0_9PROT|nr:ATP-binding cassette domain-containing protein [Pseudoroseomonas rhizosphaerae]PHK95261.1 ABC transporter ATP-binding protein [Pseudoroseomonas rhizosphaerae]
MSALLEISGIGKSFGAVRVLSGISLAVSEGETLGLIGPNGAGKTTLFNVVTGFLRADAGQVRFAGAPVDRLPPAERAARGLVRTFQKAMVFPALSLRESLAMAARQRAGQGLRWLGARACHQESAARVERLLAESGLARHGGERMADLSYGEQRIADLLMALALEPRLLLLDEPTAGLSQAEAERLLGIVRRHDARTAIVLIAHDIDIVFNHCDRIAVMHLGQLLRTGTPQAVRQDAAVRAAYLGSLAD